jgi:hypothetical protein
MPIIMVSNKTKQNKTKLNLKNLEKRRASAAGAAITREWSCPFSPHPALTGVTASQCSKFELVRESLRDRDRGLFPWWLGDGGKLLAETVSELG